LPSELVCSNSLVKMGSPSGLVIGVSAVFYLIAFGLALGAMARRSKGDVTVIDEDMGTLKCKYTTDMATGLAAGAFLFLVAAQAFVMGVTKCLCCGSAAKPGGARAIAFILFILSWICFIVASAALIAGASENKIQTKGLFSTSEPAVTCKQVQKSLFAAAAAFTFITALTAEIYFILISMARDGGSAWPAYNNNNGPNAYT